ncbi:hypothetical protein [Ectobacillus ponti]|uniref:SWIM-type domain-containing protein n=1 Tax=Ectobacillus ponti TaxID=2961894 RepID=A0AA41X2H6_9BACI|nr:hypothetical protein [Ectobacillus ponti]MCP8967709.1 hypothetical protein [Ectobacillus ponti]
MLQHSIGKEELLRMADAFIDTLNPQSEHDRTRMASGLQLYREGRVYNVSFDGYTLEGTVEDGGRIFSTSMPMTDVSQSYCECFQPGSCEHLAAVLLYAGSSFGIVGEIMKRFKNKGKPALPAVKTAKQLLQASVFTEDDYDSWIGYFTKEYDKFHTEQRKHKYREMYFLMSIFEDFYTLLLRKAPRTEGLREIFELNAAFFCFARLIEAAKAWEEQRTYSYFKAETVAERFLDEIEIFHRKLMSLTLPLPYDGLLQRTGQTLHGLLFVTSEKALEERFFTYRLLWEQLLARPEWLQEEKERVAKEELPLLKVLAEAHLQVIAGNDEAAIALLEQEPEDLIGLYYDWVFGFEARGQWDRVSRWLTFLYQLLQRCLRSEDASQYFKRDAVRHFLTAYKRYAGQQQETAGYEMLLQDLLPYSFWEYDDYLLAKKQYRTWTELHLFMGFGTELEGLKDSLKLVEKEDREAVLPLYHRAVTKAIQMKNRPAYKLAVRYLKKLRTHYKKLKRTQEWDLYIQRLSANFSRLRAFQEELQKGKLLDDTK